MGKKYAEIFNKQGISTVLDLLLHFPVFYIDFSNPGKRGDPAGKEVYRIEIADVKLNRLFRKKLSLLKINAKIAGGIENVRITLFNKPYLFDILKKNKNAYIYGKLEKIAGLAHTYNVNNPLLFTDNDSEKVLPVYRNISSLKSGTLRKLITQAFAALQDNLECLPGEIIKRYRFTGITDALRGIHMPVEYKPEKIDDLKNRFIYKDFLFFQLELQYTRNFFKKVNRQNNYTINNRVMETVKKTLGFELTADQDRTFREIIEDLKTPFNMQRLVQGDVGSGKTVIALLALQTAADNNFQGAFLAPTEILANQHFNNGKQFFKTAKIELLTGSTPAAAGEKIRDKLAKGEIDILFGTHALLSDNIKFKNLSLVVIDEQHRFGVSQRAALYYKGNSVDLLVMTATPIPRTMLLSLYDDLSVSSLKTKPRGRLPVITKIIANRRRDEFYGWLKIRIEAGEKAFIILPLIEESEFFSELRSIKKETPYFAEMFRGLPMGIVSGQTPVKEKDRLLEEFAASKLLLLVSTTVVEVGIDVKDATVMVIEDADRYGLSQLHQLRGRVGRGSRQSYCFLLPSLNITDSGKQRLKTTATTNDGFRIAEIDLKMRGGGIISGPEQSGSLDFKIGDVKRDYKIFEAARRDAALILNNRDLQNDHIANFLKKVDRKIHSLSFS